jgi:enoyl-CoA hydratase
MSLASTHVGRTLVLTIDRPPVNALDLAAVEGLRDAFSAIARDAPHDGVVLTGAGDRAFSAGVDTRAFADLDGAGRRAMVLSITAMTAALLAIPCPVVAAVNGHALGGGFVLVLACDLRLTVNSAVARFGLTEAAAGVPFPAGPAEIIRSELPPALLRRWTLSSVVVDSATLLEAGVIDARHAAHDLVDQAVQSAASLAAQPAFITVKRQVRGPLAARVASLAASGDDPFLEGFA